MLLGVYGGLQDGHVDKFRSLIRGPLIERHGKHSVLGGSEKLKALKPNERISCLRGTLRFLSEYVLG